MFEIHHQYWRRTASCSFRCDYVTLADSYFLKPFYACLLLGIYFLFVCFKLFKCWKSTKLCIWVCHSSSRVSLFVIHHHNNVVFFLLHLRTKLQLSVIDMWHCHVNMVGNQMSTVMNMKVYSWFCQKVMVHLLGVFSWLSTTLLQLCSAGLDCISCTNELESGQSAIYLL